MAGSELDFQTNAAIGGAQVTLGSATATTNSSGVYTVAVSAGEQRVVIDGESIGVINLKDRTYRGDFYVRASGCIAR